MKTCSVVNVVESSIARESQFVMPIHCGPEIGVASTKAFMGQMLVLYILCVKIAHLRGDINKETYKRGATSKGIVFETRLRLPRPREPTFKKGRGK